jgi:hypothetical protein
MIGTSAPESASCFGLFVLTRESGLFKYAADDRGQKDHRSGQKQSGNNLFSQSDATSSSRPAKLTARIEFGGPQFLLRGVDGNEQFITPTPVAANIDARPVPHRERRRERLGERFQIDGSESKTRP